MKLNKSKNKGKIHPSPFSPSSTTNPSIDPVSNLNNLLPTAILTLISILSLQDKEVLSYMITHNKKVTTFTNNNNGKSKKTSTTTHKIPSFDCGCFDCYTSYWVRWDSSPNQELIHQAIDAFEEHLSNFEQLKKVTPKSSRKNSNKLKKLDQSSSLFTTPVTKIEIVVDSPEILEVGSSENVGVESPVEVDDVAVEENNKIVNHHQQLQHKGFARKVLPDVIGLLNYRLWNLWGPNV